MDTEYGYMKIRKSALLALPHPVMGRVMSSLIKYVSGDIKPVGYRQLKNLPQKLLCLKKTLCVHHCYIFSMHEEEEDLLGMVHAIKEQWPKPHPIAIGESVQWNNWLVTVMSDAAALKDTKQFYIRSFTDNDYTFVRHGVRVVRQFKLPPVRARYSLPVIEDEDRNVALIPHFRYKNRDFGVSAKVDYSPPINLDTIINECD
jgi:hypothetical protein